MVLRMQCTFQTSCLVCAYQLTQFLKNQLFAHRHGEQSGISIWPLENGTCADCRYGKDGGARRDRTADPLLAKQVLSQLSYSPK